MTAKTLTASQLVARVYALAGELRRADIPVRLIVGGVAYAINDVWFEPHQEGRERPAICIGDDPR